MPDVDKIKNILQYALLAAGQSDSPLERQLGAIHLIKYVYLADMEYAKYNQGRTYTGIDWKFHHFGPWSTEVYRQVDEAMLQLGAEKRTFQSSYGSEDCIRWKIGFDEEFYSRLGKELPMAVRQAVPAYVGKYRDDTTSLLHFVYATRPMLRAAPGESLDFLVMPEPAKETREEFTPYLARISGRKRKKLKAGMNGLRDQFRQKLAERQTADPAGDNGKADAVFNSGVEWLDALSGEPFPDNETAVRFSDEVWKSEFRRGDG